MLNTSGMLASSERRHGTPGDSHFWNLQRTFYSHLHDTIYVFYKRLVRSFVWLRVGADRSTEDAPKLWTKYILALTDEQTDVLPFFDGYDLMDSIFSMKKMPIKS